MPHQRQAEGILGLDPGQAGSRIQQPLHFDTLGQLAVLRRDTAGDGFQLLAAGQRVLDHDEQLFELRRHLDDRRQDHDERAVLFAGGQLFGQGLHDFGRLQEAVEIDQDENRRAVFRPPGC